MKRPPPWHEDGSSPYQEETQEEGGTGEVSDGHRSTELSSGFGFGERK